MSTQIERRRQLLGQMLQRVKAEAWAEGVAWAGYDYDDAETANPYRIPTKETTP